MKVCKYKVIKENFADYTLYKINFIFPNAKDRKINKISVGRARGMADTVLEVKDQISTAWCQINR